MKKVIILSLALFFLIVTSGSASAALIAGSTFDVGDEGWRVGEFFSSTGSSVPTFVAAGGNPGGFIRTTDLYSWNAYHAPAAFLGNQSAAYGGNIHIDQKILSSDGPAYPMVVLSGNGLFLQYRTSPPGTVWTSFDIPLLASAGWEISPLNGNAGAAATEAQLQSVLSSLNFFNIEADWQTGSDQVDLDNVRLESAGAPMPAPAAILLLGSGIAGIAAFRKSFRKS